MVTAGAAAEAGAAAGTLTVARRADRHRAGITIGLYLLHADKIERDTRSGRDYETGMQQDET